MSDGIAAYLNPRDLPELKSFLARMATTPGRIVLRNDILLGFQTYCDEKGKSAQFMKRSSVAIFLNRIQEIVTGEEYLALVFRETRARSRFFRLSSDGQFMEEISAGDYLDRKSVV